MKNKKFRLYKLFGLAVIIIGVIFASCEMFAPPDIVSPPRNVSRSTSNIELNRWEELALLHMEESHVSSEEELRNMVLSLLAAEARLSEQSAIPHAQQ